MEFLFKLLALFSSAPLSLIMNQYLDEGCFPSQLRFSEIKPQGQIKSRKLQTSLNPHVTFKGT